MGIDFKLPVNTEMMVTFSITH